MTTLNGRLRCWITFSKLAVRRMSAHKICGWIDGWPFFDFVGTTAKEGAHPLRSLRRVGAAMFTLRGRKDSASLARANLIAEQNRSAQQNQRLERVP